jgi:hypothetical protein
MSLKSVIEIKDTSKRWYFASLAVLYTLLLLDSLSNHPFAKSSLGPSYLVLWILPTFIILLHLYFSRFLTWLVIVLVFSMIYLISSIDKMIDAWYWSQGVKWQTIDFWKVLLFNIVLYMVGLIILFLLRPKSKIIQKAS